MADDQLAPYVPVYPVAIGANAPLTVSSIKLIVAEALKEDAERNRALCDPAVDRCFNRADAVAGRTAYLDKRKPVFKGR